MKEDRDLQWLLKQELTDETLRVGMDRIDPIVEQITRLPMDSLPYSIGLFGSWGSGKTTALAHMAKNLSQNLPVIYFNAWKYAGFMEIVPSLIYKILSYDLSPGNESNMEKVVRVMESLGSKYGNDIGEWLKKYIAVNPVNVVKDLLEIKKEIDQPDKSRQKLLEMYYTQLDRAQDLLLDILKDKPKTVVIIDELDRCDPDEAFTVIKQLRIFFSMRGVPLLFIISANPDPIGQAIKHQYGLDPRSGDYETKRILEKFVDTYFDMSDPIPLGDHVKGLWASKNILPDQVCFVSRVDDGIHGVYFDGDVLKSTMFDAITTNNKFYNNFRVLKKSLDCALRSQHSTSLLWTVWHLEILKQVDMNFRRDIRRISSELGDIAEDTHISLLKELATSGNVKHGTGRLVKTLNIDSEKGLRAFSVFRSYFWEHTKKRLNDKLEQKSPEDREMARILNAILTDYNAVDFIIQLSLVKFTPNNGEVVFDCDRLSDANAKIEELVKDWSLYEGDFSHFAWLLANY